MNMNFREDKNIDFLAEKENFSFSCVNNSNNIFKCVLFSNGFNNLSNYENNIEITTEKSYNSATIQNFDLSITANIKRTVLQSGIGTVSTVPQNIVERRNNELLKYCADESENLHNIELRGENGEPLTLENAPLVANDIIKTVVKGGNESKLIYPNYIGDINVDFLNDIELNFEGSSLKFKQEPQQCYITDGTFFNGDLIFTSNTNGKKINDLLNYCLYNQLILNSIRMKHSVGGDAIKQNMIVKTISPFRTTDDIILSCSKFKDEYQYKNNIVTLKDINILINANRYIEIDIYPGQTELSLFFD